MARPKTTEINTLKVWINMAHFAGISWLDHSGQHLFQLISATRLNPPPGLQPLSCLHLPDLVASQLHIPSATSLKRSQNHHSTSPKAKWTASSSRSESLHPALQVSFGTQTPLGPSSCPPPGLHTGRDQVSVQVEFVEALPSASAGRATWSFRSFGCCIMLHGSSSGWCFQPLWKILVSWDDYSHYMVK